MCCHGFQNFKGGHWSHGHGRGSWIDFKLVESKRLGTYNRVTTISFPLGGNFDQEFDSICLTTILTVKFFVGGKDFSSEWFFICMRL